MTNPVRKAATTFSGHNLFIFVLFDPFALIRLRHEAYFERSTGRQALQGWETTNFLMGSVIGRSRDGVIAGAGKRTAIVKWKSRITSICTTRRSAVDQDDRQNIKGKQAVEKGSPASLRCSITSLQRISKYASARRFSRASHLDLFEQPESEFLDTL
jgi:hypothetical protein